MDRQNNQIDAKNRDNFTDPLTDLLRSGAKDLIQRAVTAELEELLELYSDRRTETGRAAVVRNGHLPERDIQTGIGPVKVKVPKIRSLTGDPVTFRSA